MRFVVFFAVLFLNSALQAADLISVEVAPNDGAVARSPKLNLTVVFPAQETRATVQITVLSNEINDQGTPVQIPFSYRQAQAPIELVRKSNPASLGVEKFELTVPYEQLVALTGYYKVRYSVERISAGPQNTSETSTALATLTVTAAGEYLWQELTDAPLMAPAIVAAKPGPVAGGSAPPVGGGPDVENTPEVQQINLDKLRKFLETLDNPAPLQPFNRPTAEEKLTAQKWYNDQEDPTHKVVFFVTNRPVISTADRDRPWRIFEPGFGATAPAKEMVMGSVIAHVPSGKYRAPGELDEKKYHFWGKDNRNPDGLFFIQKLLTFFQHPVAPKLFTNQFLFTDYMWEQDVLLFIHGYNNTFESAVLQAAQLKQDLKWPGPVVALSWPSLGDIPGYFTDETNEKASVPQVAYFLDGLLHGTEVKNTPRGKRYVVAHSMGNRLFLDSVALMSSQKRLFQKSFGKVVLAAPDVHLEDFYKQVPLLASAAEETTLYYSKKDTALSYSRKVHFDYRAGFDGAFLPGVINSICADNANWRDLRSGHGYFAGGERVMLDINLSFLYGFTPEQRNTMIFWQPVDDPRQSHWEFYR